MAEIKAYSGLIRNHVELAHELGIDVSGLTREDREKLLVAAGYETWGSQVGAHINGQFAFAVFDEEKDELFCARDPLGAELFFYCRTADGVFLFGSDIREIISDARYTLEFNEALLQLYLGFTYVPGEETLFKGIHKLEPGGYLRFGADGMKAGRYWSLSYEPDESKSLDDWADEISAALDASLHDICDEGEEPDSFLSGGVDSSYIMAKSNAKTGFCVSYESRNASEDNEARATAKTLGRDFESVMVTPNDFFGCIDEFLLTYEQPSADASGLALFAASKKIARKTSLCFSGEGADEFFAGYGAYAHAGGLRAMLRPVYYGTTYIMDEAEQRRYLKRYYDELSAKALMKRIGAEGGTHDPLTKMLYVDMRSYFEGSILLNSAKISRGTGLDIRMPFCDLRMLDVARRMPARFKAFKGENKVALRSAASRVLPREVAYRSKLGFPVPIREWLRSPEISADIRRSFESDIAAEFFDLGEIGALLDAFLGIKPRVAHPVWFARHKALLWRHVWTIYLFIRWYELFFCEGAD